MKGEVFIDSGAFIAFLVRRDRLHQSAVELFATPPRHWSTSVLVVAETYGWFLHRLGEEEARTFRAFLDQLSGLAILDTDEAHRRGVWEKLDRLRGVKLTYVDASSPDDESIGRNIDHAQPRHTFDDDLNAVRDDRDPFVLAFALEPLGLHTNIAARKSANASCSRRAGWRSGG